MHLFSTLQEVAKVCIENEWVKEAANFILWEIYIINPSGSINTLDSGEIYF